MFKPVNKSINFPDMEKDILEWWEKHGVVKKYLNKNQNSSKRYSFIDGPITANNPMGVHHAWGRTYKDLFQRYYAMKGYDQRFQNGFDGQGLWIEVEVEKELQFKSKKDIEVFGVDKFVNLCKQRVMKFADIQSQQSIRLGYWMNWDNSYHTMSDENNYMIWQFLKKCFERGLIYEGTDVMPWCPRCGTGLSEHEIATEGYKDIVHDSLFVLFPLKSVPNESLLIWTTTPWTLTANTGVAVNPEIDYVKAKLENGNMVYVAKERLKYIGSDLEVVTELKGSELIGLTYDGPFDFLPSQQKVERKVVPSDTVTTEEGTGLVHMAPAAGKEDFIIGKAEGLAIISPIDDQGKFLANFGSFSGRTVFEVKGDIINSLQEREILFRVEKYKHRYPVCWRCDTELVFRLVDEWFISMDGLRSEIATVVKQVNWIPEFGLQRELDWLKNMSDWMISKKRYWGLALPIYKCSCGHFDVIGSKEELKERAVEGFEEFEGNSPHKPWIDKVVIECQSCGGKVKRILDVGNPWLDAGIVAFSTLEYNKNKNYWKKWYPADMITESFPGQFRNWFYSFLTMSTVLESSIPTKAIFGYALVRDEKGNEMHKSKGNAVWFDDAAEEMGVDVMRWLYTRQNPSSNLNFGYGIGDEIRRRHIIPLWNVYSFFVTYANIDSFNPTDEFIPFSDISDHDKWIISELNILIRDVSIALEHFQPDVASHRVEDFLEILSNWYVRRSRRRFWKSGEFKPGQEFDSEKLMAYQTLYTCLVSLSKLIAPFMPFLAEEIYQNLANSFGLGCESVHLEGYPQTDENLILSDLSKANTLALRVCSLARSLRTSMGVGIRQPLSQLRVWIDKNEEKPFLLKMEKLICDELNIKELKSINKKELSEYVDFQLDVDYSVLGPIFGAKLNKVVSHLNKMQLEKLMSIVETSTSDCIKVDVFDVPITGIRFQPINKKDSITKMEKDLAVVLDTKITKNLEMEGIAREIVHRVQTLRRDAEFELTDQVNLTYFTESPVIEGAINAFENHIMSEVLATKINKTSSGKNSKMIEYTIRGDLLFVEVLPSSNS